MFTISKPNDWNILHLYEKICYYKQYLNENYANCVDKIVVKKIIKDFLCDEIKIANIVRVLKDFEDFNEYDINDNHILKSAHGSGWNIDLENANIAIINNKLKSWNKSYGTDSNEPHYNFIKPRFFIEEKIKDKFGKKYASTFMFRCINGKPETFSIKIDSSINNFDIHKNILKPKEHNYEIEDVLFQKMKKYAEILSKPFEFVRIDFFIDRKNDIYFSEFTFTPLGGKKYYSDEIELKLGKLWT